ncbi:MAG: HIT family protein [Firmicutes bacterium]|nr:HIT family protein [Bacillota bacterium]
MEIKYSCIFCKPEIRKNTIMENDLAFVIYDKFPQTKGHLLIIPKRHSETFFNTTTEEQVAICELLANAKIYLDKNYKPEGFNIVTNCGAVSGQVVFHTHVHLIPRYNDDNGRTKAPNGAFKPRS